MCEDCAERGGSGLQEAEARAALAALSPNNSTCVLCAHLFPWLRSEHCAVALQALLSSLSSSSSSSSSSVLSCSRVALHCELSAGLALREALLARPLAPAAPLALRLLRQQLRPLLPASMREEEGGVTILLSGTPRVPVLCLLICSYSFASCCAC